MKTIEVDKLIAGLEWESRRGHYTTENRMALLNELKALKQALNRDLVMHCSMCTGTNLVDCGSDEYECADCGHFPITS